VSDVKIEDVALGSSLQQRELQDHLFDFKNLYFRLADLLRCRSELGFPGIFRDAGAENHRNSDGQRISIGCGACCCLDLQ
jgi:hypothetical protein